MTKSSTNSGAIIKVLGMATFLTTIVIFILMAIRYVLGIGAIGYQKTQTFNATVLSKKGFFIGKKISLLDNESHYRLTVATEKRLTTSPLRVKILDKDHRIINEFLASAKNSDDEFILDKKLKMLKQQDIYFALSLPFDMQKEPTKVTVELTNASRSIQLSYHLRVFWIVLVSFIVITFIEPNSKKT